MKQNCGEVGSKPYNKKSQQESTPDSELVTLILRGDKEAFETLMRRYQSLVYSIIFNIVKDPEDAKDLHQDVFVAAYRNIKQIKQIDRWLCRVAGNMASTFLQQKKKREKKIKENFAPSSPPTPDEILIEKEFYENVENIKNQIPKIKLSKQQKKVLDLVMEGLDNREISRKTGINRGTVRSTRRHVRIGMKNQLLKHNRFNPIFSELINK